MSRFKWGLTIELGSPDYETRMAILLSKMEKLNIQLPENVRDYLCQNVKTNIREIEGMLISLIAQSSLNKRAIDIPLLKKFYKSIVLKLSKVSAWKISSKSFVRLKKSIRNC
ncbi:MAG: hypothetical protein IPK61_11600 [Saprospiraceae bacterium]|nr:hypothetical protein [Saprospiraceae bacterium]